MTGNLGEPKQLCPECGEFLIEGWITDSFYDFYAARAAGLADNEHNPAFAYVYDWQKCEDEECGWTGKYGPRWYYSAETNNYTLNAPDLSKVEVQS